MNSDKLRFTGICIISISIIYLATSLIYIGYEATQIRRMIPEVIPTLVHEIEAVRKDIPIILDRTDNIIANARELSEKAGEGAGKGAVKGAFKGIIGLPIDAAKKVIQTPVEIKDKIKENKEKNDVQKEQKPDN